MRRKAIGRELIVGSEIKVTCTDGTVCIGTLISINLYVPNPNKLYPINVDITLKDDICKNSWIEPSGEASNYSNACIPCREIRRLEFLE